MAYEHVIDSAAKKAQDLSAASSSSQVSDDSTSMLQQYKALQEHVKVLFLFLWFTSFKRDWFSP